MKTTLQLFLLGAALTLGACKITPAEPLPPPPPATVTSFTVTPASVAKPGDLVTLAWATQNASSTALEQVGVGAVAIDAAAASGSVQVPVSASGFFVLTARGEGGTDARAVAVNVMSGTGGVLFVALPAQVRGGDAVTLAWSAPGVGTLTLEETGGAPLDLGGQKESGAVQVTPSKSTSYTLTADGVAKTAAVTVVPVIKTFEPGGPSPDAGTAFSVRWETLGATKVTLSRAGVTAPLATETDPARVAQGSFTDTVPANLPVDGVLTYTLDAESGALKSTSQLVVRVGGGLSIRTFTAPDLVQSGTGTFTVSWTTQGADTAELLVDGQPSFVAATAAEVAGASAQVPVPATSTTVELVARTNRGGEVRARKTVTAVGPVQLNSFTADKAAIAAGGEKVTLSWNVANARWVQLREVGGRLLKTFTGTVDTGTLAVYPNRSTTTYELQADNQTGQPGLTPQTLDVTVATPATLVFSNRLPPGATVQVTGTTAVGGGGPLLGIDELVPSTAEQFIDISATGTATINSSSASETHALGPWSLYLLGQAVDASSVNISPNGWISFSSTAISGPNTDLTSFGTSLPALAIAPFMRNLQEGTLGEAYWQVDTLPSGKRLIVQWNHVQLEVGAVGDATFEVQVYSSGKVVFAYGAFSGFTTASGLIGINNATQTGAILPAVPPVPGDVLVDDPAALHPLPVAITVTGPITLLQQMPDGLLELSGDPQLPPGQFGITEVNPFPAATVVDGEWLEVTNFTSTAIDLSGWDLVFGAGASFTLPAGTVLPADGRLVFGQTADLGGQAAAGTAIAYGNALAMSDTGGTVSLGIVGGTYASLTWSALTAGTAFQTNRPAAGLLYATGTTFATCVGNPGTTYGAALQVGTPGAANTACVPYAAPASVPVNFETIGAAPGVVRVLSATADDTGATVTLTAPQAIPLFGALRTSIYVCANGFITVGGTSCLATEKTVPSASVPVGTVAAFWDDLQGANLAGSGVWRLFKDPDGTPGTGDEYTILSWEGWKVFGSTNPGALNFQMKFFADGSIEYHYATITGGARYTGSSATTWIEAQNGTAALPFNVHQGLILPNTAYRFAYAP